MEYSPVACMRQNSFCCFSESLGLSEAAGVRPGGRKSITPAGPRVVTANWLNKDRSLGIDQICGTLEISTPTFYRYLALSDGADNESVRCESDR